MKKIIAIITLIVLAMPAYALASCTETGSNSHVWNCGPTYTELNNLINLGSPSGFDPNDTVNVSAGDGTESWSSALALTRGIKLIGPGYGNLEISRSDSIIDINPSSTARTNEEIIKVTGFSFNGNNAAIHFISIAGPSTSPIVKNIMIGENRFLNSSTSTGDYQAAIFVEGQVRGVIYNNIFDRCNVILVVLGNDTFDPEWSNFGPSMAFGTEDNLFFEDNTISYSTSYDGSDPGWTETGHSGRAVVRYNTWNLTNANGQEIWDIHGSQYNPSGQAGTMVSEYYGNTLSNMSGYRWIHMRGGWGLFFNNIGTGSLGDNNVSDYDGSCDSITGYPTQIRNTYFWNNMDDGTNIEAYVLQDNCSGSLPLTENSRFWNYNGSCSGSGSCSSGIGRGTTAPTGTCTTGVGYWVASTATQTVNSGIIQAGTFYKCTATNTWTAYYTPYTYPHPLRGGGDTTAPTVTGCTIKNASGYKIRTGGGGVQLRLQ